MGNGIDDDGDGLIDEEDEVYIGPMTRTGGSPSAAPISSKFSSIRDFRPGDKIDNDGDGFIDEADEGVDDPTEFNIFRPLGNDRPYSTVDDLQLVNFFTSQPAPPSQGRIMIPSLFDILRQSVTIYSQSDEYSGPLSGARNEIAKINPNTARNWRAVDLWEQLGIDSNRADFQYSPPVRLEDLIALQVDLDGDWQLYAEPDVEAGNPDGIDNDGDGLIDEPSDDWIISIPARILMDLPKRIWVLRHIVTGWTATGMAPIRMMVETLRKPWGICVVCQEIPMIITPAHGGRMKPVRPSCRESLLKAMAKTRMEMG